jgi:hypothetical protein
MKIRILFFAILIFAAASLAAYGETVRILIQDTVIDREGKVLLQDIAKIEGADSSLKAHLEGIQICSVPPAGLYLRISRDTLLTKILRTGIAMDSFDLRMEKTVRISSGHAVVTGNTILTKTRQYLKESSHWTGTLRLISETIPKPVKVHEGEITYDFTVDESESGILRVTVKILSNGKEEDSRTITFRTGKKSQSAEVKPDAAVKGEEDKNSEPEKTTKNSVVEKVRRGDPLKLMIIKNNMTITIEGTAAQNGVPGDRIRVTAGTDKKIYNATLIDTNSATIDF